MRFRLWFLAITSIASAAVAEEARIGYFEMPPFTFEIDGHADGRGAALIRTLTDGLAVNQQIIKMPIQRLLHDLQHDDVIAINLARTKEREAMGLVWVAQVYDGDLVFASLVGHPLIDSFEQAARLSRVGANRASAPEELLRSHGLTNIDPAIDMHSNVQKLRNGHVDAMLDTKLFIEEAWHELGYDPALLQFGKPQGHFPIWIAASPAIDPAIVATMRARFAALSQHERDSLFAPLWLAE